jgi:hypothetical protein
MIVDTPQRLESIRKRLNKMWRGARTISLHLDESRRDFSVQATVWNGARASKTEYCDDTLFDFGQSLSALLEDVIETHCHICDVNCKHGPLSVATLTHIDEAREKANGVRRALVEFYDCLKENG